MFQIIADLGGFLLKCAELLSLFLIQANVLPTMVIINVELPTWSSYLDSDVLYYKSAVIHFYPARQMKQNALSFLLSFPLLLFHNFCRSRSGVGPIPAPNLTGLNLIIDTCAYRVTHFWGAERQPF